MTVGCAFAFRARDNAAARAASLVLLNSVFIINTVNQYRKKLLQFLECSNKRFKSVCEYIGHILQNHLVFSHVFQVSFNFKGTKSMHGAPDNHGKRFRVELGEITGLLTGLYDGQEQFKSLLSFFPMIIHPIEWLFLCEH